MLRKIEWNWWKRAVASVFFLLAVVVILLVINEEWATIFIRSEPIIAILFVIFWIIAPRLIEVIFGRDE